MNSQSYYSRSEAAAILKVSKTTVSRYMHKGLLNYIENCNRILIPCEEVHNFYHNNNTSSSISLQEFEEMKIQMDSLKSDIEVLKSALGVGKRFAILSDHDLQTIYRKIMQLLTLESWEINTIFEVCDIGLSLKSKDLGRLILMEGSSVWNCLLDLLNRMEAYICNVSITENGQDIISTRIQAIRNRLYGMIYVEQSRIQSDDALWLQSIEAVPSTDLFVLEFLKNRKYYNTNQ